MEFDNGNDQDNSIRTWVLGIAQNLLIKYSMEVYETNTTKSKDG